MTRKKHRILPDPMLSFYAVIRLQWQVQEAPALQELASIQEKPL
jgi:hypothetical protein